MTCCHRGPRPESSRPPSSSSLCPRKCARLPLFARASCYLHPPEAEAPVVLQVLRDYRPTLFFSVPTVYAGSCARSCPRTPFRRRGSASRRESASRRGVQAWRERSASRSSTASGHGDDLHVHLERVGRSRAGSTGTPVDGTEVKLLDAAGERWPTALRECCGPRRPRRRPLTGSGSITRGGSSWATGSGPRCLHARRRRLLYPLRARGRLFKVAGQWVVPADVEAAADATPRGAEAGVVGAEEASASSSLRLRGAPRSRRRGCRPPPS